MSDARYKYRGVTVAWDPAGLILRMRHGADPTLDDHTAWVLGSQMGLWIEGFEGRVAAIVDASGVDRLPDDWLAYWAKVLRQGFIKGVAVHGASREFARAARDLGRVTGVPVIAVRDEAEALARLRALPAQVHPPA